MVICNTTACKVGNLVLIDKVDNNGSCGLLWLVRGLVLIIRVDIRVVIYKAMIPLASVGGNWFRPWMLYMSGDHEALMNRLFRTWFSQYIVRCMLFRNF